MLAPEGLAEALNLGADGWVFVGASGATYESQSALADFARSTAPPTPLARVSAVSVALVGVSRSGDVLRSTDLGFNWSTLDVPGRATDVAMLESGHGLLLLAPEALLSTSDAGASWKPTSQGPFGAVALSTEAGAVRVDGVLEARLWSPGKNPAWTDTDRTHQPSYPKLSVGVRASAAAVASGHAVFTRGRYYELAAPKGGWLLRRGPELAATTQHAVPAFRGCAKMRLAARGAELYAFCGEDGEGAVVTRLLKSDDSGGQWKRLPRRLRADFQRLTASVLHDGSVVLAGICPPDASEGGCVPSGVYLHRAGAGEDGSLERLGVSLLSGVPLGMGTVGDGKRLIVVGKRQKGPELVVFTASVEDYEFSTEEVSEVSVDMDQRYSNQTSLRVEALSPGADGNVAVVLFERNSGTHSILVLDGRGRLLSLGKPPTELARVGASGGFAVAYDPRSGAAWESLDGGVSWDSLGQAPKTLCPADKSKPCEVALSCWQRGCVFHDQFSRVGWRGEGPKSRPPLAPAFGRPNRADTLRTPIACQLDDAEGFRTVAGLRPPDASQAELGDVAWFAFDADWRDASVTMFEALRGPEAIVERVELLPKVAAPAEHAMYASLQIEGVAAMRQSASRGVEVVWRNLFEGRQTRKSRLTKSARVVERATRFVAQAARPGLLSITRDGLFMRPSESSAAGSTYLVQRSGVTVLPPVTWPEGSAKGRGEMIRAPDGPLAVSLIDAGAAIVRQRHVGGRWERDAVTLGLLRPQLFDVRQAFDLAYLGDRPGLHLMFLDAAPSSAWWFPFQAGAEPFGEPVTVPTQASLAARPATCGTSQRNKSPRAVTPSELGTRHPVLITHTTEPYPPMLTNDAVLFGTQDEPCVATFHANSTRKEGEEYSALIIADGASTSWLFRASKDADEFDARSMRCSYSPTLELPVDFDVFSSGQR